MGFSIEVGFPGGSDGKQSACNVGDPGSTPRWVRLQYSCPNCKGTSDVKEKKEAEKLPRRCLTSSGWGKANQKSCRMFWTYLEQ